jgi:hypothetical protein
VGGQGNVTAFCNKLANVAKWTEDRLWDQACKALSDADERIDGLPLPSDWATGPAVPEFRAGIQALMTTIGCGA